MLSKSDIAIKENIEKEHTCETFFNQVLINHDSLDEIEKDFVYFEIDKACHIWQGAKDKKGYGKFTVYSKGPKRIKAHRFAFAHEFGFDALPEGLENGHRYVLNHLCYNRACVNPYHLEVITSKENNSREKRKPKGDK